MSYVKNFNLETFTAAEIANIVPWYGDYVRVEDVEQLLQQLLNPLGLDEDETLELESEHG